MPITDCFSCCECDCCSIECEGDCTWIYRCDPCDCTGTCTWVWTPCDPCGDCTWVWDSECTTDYVPSCTGSWKRAGTCSVGAWVTPTKCMQNGGTWTDTPACDEVDAVCDPCESLPADFPDGGDPTTNENDGTTITFACGETPTPPPETCCVGVEDYQNPPTTPPTPTFPPDITFTFAGGGPNCNPGAITAIGNNSPADCENASFTAHAMPTGCTQEEGAGMEIDLQCNEGTWSLEISIIDAIPSFHIDIEADSATTDSGELVVTFPSFDMLCCTGVVVTATGTPIPAPSALSLPSTNKSTPAEEPAFNKFAKIEQYLKRVRDSRSLKALETCEGGTWEQISTCPECPECSCTFAETWGVPGEDDPPNPENAQTYTGTCGDGEEPPCGTCIYTSVFGSSVWSLPPTGVIHSAGTDYKVGNHCSQFCFCPPMANGSSCGSQGGVLGGIPIDTITCTHNCNISADLLSLTYNPPPPNPCYWELVTDCGESNNSGCQCASRKCEWTWEVSEAEPTITPGTWTQTSDCGCDNCDCPAPSGMGSPIPGAFSTMTTNCSGEGMAGEPSVGAGHTVSCDCDIPTAASAGYVDGDTATTPCYGGDCDTSNASCCAGGDCMYTWSGGAWIVGDDDTDTCPFACEDPDVLCECHEPTYPGSVDNESGNGTCMPAATTAAVSNRTFGLVNKIPQIRNSREEIRNASAIKVTRKGVSKVYLNVKAIKRKRQAMARHVASRRQRMR